MMKSSKKYRPILILTALPFESKIILSHHNINIKPKKLTTYQLDESTHLIEVPIGSKFDLPIFSREAEKLSPKLLVNFGICGALDGTVSVGEPFQIDRLFYFEKGIGSIQLRKILNIFQSASLLTVDEAVLKTKQRDELNSQTGCRLVDMEAFHIARFWQAYRHPLLIVKIASDFADEETLGDIKVNRTMLKQSLADNYKRLITSLS